MHTRPSFLFACFLTIGMMVTFIQESLSMHNVDYDDCQSLRDIRLRVEAHYEADYQGPDDTLNLEALMTRTSLVTGVNKDSTLDQELLRCLIEERWALTPQVGRPIVLRRGEEMVYGINAQYLALLASRLNFTPSRTVYASEMLAKFFRHATSTLPLTIPRSTWLGIVLPHEFSDAQFLFDLVYREIIRLRLRLILPLNAFVRNIVYYVTDNKDSTQEALWFYHKALRPFHERLQTSLREEKASPAEVRSVETASLSSPALENLPSRALPPTRPLSLITESAERPPSSPSTVPLTSRLSEMVALLRQASVDHTHRGNSVIIRFKSGSLASLSYFVVQQAQTLDELHQMSSPFVASLHPERLYSKDYPGIRDYFTQQMSKTPSSERSYSQIPLPQLHSLLPWLLGLIDLSQILYFQHLGAEEWYDGFSYQLRMTLPETVMRIIFCKDEKLYRRIF